MKTARNGSACAKLRASEPQQHARGVPPKQRAPVHGRQRRRRRQQRLEALNLAAKKVAAHRDVQPADERLPALLLACHAQAARRQRAARADTRRRATRVTPTARSARKMRPAHVPQMGRPLVANSRSAGICRMRQRAARGAAVVRRRTRVCGATAPHVARAAATAFRSAATYQAPALRHERHRGALAAGDDEAAQVVQLLRLAHLAAWRQRGSSAPPPPRAYAAATHLDSLCARLGQADAVLAKGALQREHADARPSAHPLCSRQRHAAAVHTARSAGAAAAQLAEGRGA